VQAEKLPLDGRESLLWIRVDWHVGLFWKAKPFPTSPEPLTFTLQRFTDLLTLIRRTFKWPCIHEHRSVNTLKTEFTKKRGINAKPKNAALKSLPSLVPQNLMELILSPSKDATSWLRLERDDLAGRRYGVETSICPSPVCKCERVRLRCFPETTEQSPHPSVPGAGFSRSSSSMHWRGISITGGEDESTPANCMSR